MKTRLTTLLGIDLPIIQAPMGGSGGHGPLPGAGIAELAAAVSNAGGLGMLPIWHYDDDTVRESIRRTRSLTDRPFGVNLNLNWPQEDRLKVCLTERVPIVHFFWGEPKHLVHRAHTEGAIVLETVSTPAEARTAVENKVDAVVAQGWEAGGHVRGTIATLALVPAVVDAAGDTPVVAAGGIADGRGLAAVLALGAAGAWIGTRFLAGNEAAIHPDYRRRLFEAGAGDTVYSDDLFDIGWPDAPHRVLRNRIADAWEAAGRPAPGSRPGEGEVLAKAPSGDILRYQSHTPGHDTTGDIEALSLWAGQGVGLVRKAQPAGAIVREIAEEARATLKRLAATTG